MKRKQFEFYSVDVRKTKYIVMQVTNIYSIRSSDYIIACMERTSFVTPYEIHKRTFCESIPCIENI